MVSGSLLPGSCCWLAVRQAATPTSAASRVRLPTVPPRRPGPRHVGSWTPARAVCCFGARWDGRSSRPRLDLFFGRATPNTKGTKCSRSSATSSATEPWIASSKPNANTGRLEGVSAERRGCAPPKLRRHWARPTKSFEISPWPARVAPRRDSLRHARDAARSASLARPLPRWRRIEAITHCLPLARYVVAPGGSVSTTNRGVVEPGRPVTADCFAGGQADIDDLVRRGVIVDRGATT